MDQIKVSGMRFLDEHGRERILNGMNVVDKKDFDEKAKIAEQCDFTTANAYLEAERARSIAFLKNSIEN